jgi:hypothetical protein
MEWTTEQERKLDQIHHALIGDELGNPGLISRIKAVEEYQEKDQAFKYKVAGGLFVGSTALGAFWSWMMKHF